MMRFMLAILVLACLIAPALAQTTCQQVGQFRYCNSDDTSTTKQSIGQFDYYNGTTRSDDGSLRSFNRTCQHVGQFTYCN